LRGLCGHGELAANQLVRKCPWLPDLCAATVSIRKNTLDTPQIKLPNNLIQPCIGVALSSRSESILVSADTKFSVFGRSGFNSTRTLCPLTAHPPVALSLRLTAPAPNVLGKVGDFVKVKNLIN
jgi:hypothetical protein